MKFVTGWWVTDAMTTGAGSVVGRAQELQQHFTRLRGRQVAVQAGGHVGVYPAALAAEFDTVYTFEPEHRNFECLVRNVPRNVFAARGALGDKRGCVELRVHGKCSGGHSIGGAGRTPLYRIDDLALTACDALFLDLEGFEVHALRGAVKTISAFRPLVVAEENKKLRGQGFEFGDVEKLLAPFGYSVVDRVGEDIVLEATSP